MDANEGGWRKVEWMKMYNSSGKRGYKEREIVEKMENKGENTKEEVDNLWEPRKKRSR